MDSTAKSLPEQSEEIRDALVAHCRLSGEQVERVNEAMKALHLDFAAAAVHIGIVTRNELDQTIDFVNYTTSQQESSFQRESSIVETAMRRRKPSRDVIVRPREIVTPSHELILAHDPYNARSERLRALRTELMLLDDTPSQCYVLALVSPSPGEGRSLLAGELAIAFSQLRRRTLLIDADLRRPRQHVLFGAEIIAGGLAQALATGSPPALLGVEGLPNLSILTSGPIAPNPLELLSDGRFGRLVTKFRYDFDNIVIDTPPVSNYADGLAIATTAGRALVIGRAAKTPRRDMKDMMRRLVTTQARVMGAVLSCF